MEPKSGLEVGGYGNASVLIAKAHDRGLFIRFSVIALLVTASAGVVFSLSGWQLFQPVFGEPFPGVSPNSGSASNSATDSFQPAVSGNSYYRAMSESMSVASANGNSGSSSPVSYQRSISESLSLTTMQGKVPNSYSRAMSEQGSLTTGMPSSTAPVAAQPSRASMTPYSAGSNQRTDERFNLRSLSSGKADSTYRGGAGETTAYSTASTILNAEQSDSGSGIMIQDTASVDAGEGETSDHSSNIRYVLANIGAAQYNAGYNYANSVLYSTEGLVLVFIVLRRSISVTTAATKFATICGAKVHNSTLGSPSEKTALQTRVIVILLVLFSITAVASISNPIFGQAAADTNGAGAAYRSSTNTLNTPKYREWDPATLTWSSEVELPTTGAAVRDTLLLFNPTNSERVILAYNANGDIQLYRCLSACTVSSHWSDKGVVANTGAPGAATPDRPFYAAYEQQSGKLVIVYDKNLNQRNDFYWQTWDGLSLSAESGFNYIGGNGNDNEAIIHFRMTSKSNSNEIAMILEDATNQGASVFIWNPGAATFGNQWTVTTTMGASSILGEAIGIAYETSSGAAVAFAGNGVNSANWVRWNPGTSSWSAPASQDTDFPATLTNDVRFVTMKSDPVSTSNKIMITVVDDNSRISTRQIDAGTWSGANWVMHTAGSPSIVTRAVDFAWDPSGSTGAIFYETSGIADITITRNTWTGSSAAWGISATLSVANSIHY